MATVVHQFYQTRVIDEFVLRGNAGLLKCNLPSFVADFVDVESWIADDGMEIYRNSTSFGRVCDQKPFCAYVEFFCVIGHKMEVDFQFILSPVFSNSILPIIWTKQNPYLNSIEKRVFLLSMSRIC